jgi:hypothetical protein
MSMYPYMYLHFCLVHDFADNHVRIILKKIELTFRKTMQHALEKDLSFILQLAITIWVRRATAPSPGVGARYHPLLRPYSYPTGGRPLRSPAPPPPPRLRRPATAMFLILGEARLRSHLAWYAVELAMLADAACPLPAPRRGQHTSCSPVCPALDAHSP